LAGVSEILIADEGVWAWRIAPEAVIRRFTRSGLSGSGRSWPEPFRAWESRAGLNPPRLPFQSNNQQEI